MIPVSTMIQRMKLANGTPFIAFNAAAILFVIVMLFAPILSHFATRSESIADNAAQLAHFQNVMRAHDKSAGSVGRSGDPFLADNEERIASADLQAHLKSMGANAGVTVLAIRGLQNARVQPLHMVAVSVELEGPLKAVRDMIFTIESETPLLFVTAASFRSLADGEDGPIRADLKIQGAIRDGSRGGGGLSGVNNHQPAGESATVEQMP
jgi:general secretion pathway protein M